MRQIYLLLIGIICAASSAPHSPDATVEFNLDELTAKQIIERMAKTYAECETYIDTGVIITDYIKASGKRTVEETFKTAFFRPDSFRFEYSEKKGDNLEKKCIVWRKGREVQSWWYNTLGIEKEESLFLAIAGASGVSSGSANTISRLLMPIEIQGRPLTSIDETERIEDAKLDDVECFRIQGQFRDPMTIWIDKETFLVRRIDREKKFDDFRTETTTTYDPVIDEEIAESLLEFNPPESPAPAAQSEPFEAAPARDTLGPFPIHTVNLRFIFGHVLTEDEVLAMVVDLVVEKNVLVPSGEDDSAESIRLADLPAASKNGTVPLSADAIQVYCRTIADAHIDLGLVGVWVRPDEAALGNGELLLEIVLGTVGRVQVVTTDTQGVQLTDPVKYQWVLDESPILPGDFVYREKLKAYALSLARKLGLKVDTSLSVMPEGPGVLVTFLIELK